MLKRYLEYLVFGLRKRDRTSRLVPGGSSKVLVSKEYVNKDEKWWEELKNSKTVVKV